VSRTPVPTVFLGSGEFAVPVLEALCTLPDVHVVAVVTAPPRPSGRGHRPRPSRVASRADELGIGPVLTPTRLRDPDSVAALEALSPDLLVLADYGQIVPPAILALPLHRALNLHPSLLPRHRGASPVPAAILDGDTDTGVTLMVMDDGLDTGPIVAQVALPLDGTETAPALEARLASEAADLLAAVLPEWLLGTRRAAAQPSRGATLTRPLRREDGRIDLTRPAHQLERQVRAFQPWPGSWVDTPEGRLTLWSVRPLSFGAGSDISRPGSGEDRAGGAYRPRGGPPEGTLVPDGGGLALAVSDGALRLDEVQLAGGRRMTSAELRRGHPGLAGAAVS
jgi:methionyl-tRNA formyltransferase